MPEDNASPKTTSDHPRLPCRGCTSDCKNYAVCEGIPWRMDRDGKVPNRPAGT